ncbi:M23 family metallopeptidase [Saccharibacillus sp. CPCC 101409]|uniref:M23 family metallopeptidase n=1 Tax=Saccharibacillus sp. CPCC 101409 TaxID=3058041 RepID=UPI002673C69F|nr:M23 family metallopeptidase [Saccharibacillus sp. CPCC 101409]MDO3409683.1 M23 family metallopeptidase [Saccharibacillus sp. CPCC 101409]
MESQSSSGPSENVSLEQSDTQPEMRRPGTFTAGTRGPNRARKWAAGILGSVALAGGLTFAGFRYIEDHTTVYYTVYSGDEAVGTIADKQQLADLIAKKQREFSKKYPDADMKLYADGFRAEAAEGYKAEPATQATLDKLDGMIKAYATGVELLVDGQAIGIVKDEDTAKKLIDKVEKSYIEKGTQTSNAVKKLASTGASSSSAEGSASKLESIKVNEKVSYADTKTSPDRILTEAKAYDLLKNGEEKPVTYTVAEGDTVSSIAARFEITQDEIYANNADIEEFTLQIGQKLRITLPDPAITVTTVESVSEQMPTAAEIEIRHSSEMYVGKRMVISKGRKGVKEVNYRLTKENGEIVREEWIGQEVVKKSSPMIVVKGTKAKPVEKPVVEIEEKTLETSLSAASSPESSTPSESSDSEQQEPVSSSGSGFGWPVGGASISSTFGTRWGKLHAGVDLTGSSNIMASAPGTVTYAGQMNGYGNIIIVSHGDGFETRYGHLSSIGVSVGQSVSRGESIGVMGNTGRSTGTHLHFEIRHNGSPENPLSYLP